jgi:succinoglycan biosynthesis protein ExoA
MSFTWTIARFGGTKRVYGPVTSRPALDDRRTHLREEQPLSTQPELDTLPADPVVTLVVAMRNEAPNIGRTVSSILGQDYPPELLEVLILDGESSDGSLEIARSLVGDRAGWRLGTNPLRIQAAAWNLGIETATGDVIGILSGHAELGPSYVRGAVEVLRRTGADMVGGPVQAIGEGAMGQAVARAVGTPFGVGGASFRYLDHEADVDTVFMGLCRRSTYRRFRFDEEMVRNQDDELSYRLLDAGARIVCSPRIQSTYRSRATLSGLWLQYLDYGRWKVRVIQKHPGQVRPRHLIPAVLVLALGSTAVAAFLWPPARIALALIVAAYAVGVGSASLLAARGLPPTAAILLPVVYPVLHLGYGVGFWLGLAQFRHRWGAGALRGAVRSLVRHATS